MPSLSRTYSTNTNICNHLVYLLTNDDSDSSESYNLAYILNALENQLNIHNCVSLAYLTRLVSRLTSNIAYLAEAEIITGQARKITPNSPVPSHNTKTSLTRGRLVLLYMLHVGFICFNLCCMWDLFVLIYVACGIYLFYLMLHVGLICFNLFGDILFIVIFYCFLLSYMSID